MGRDWTKGIHKDRKGQCWTTPLGINNTNLKLSRGRDLQSGHYFARNEVACLSRKISNARIHWKKKKVAPLNKDPIPRHATTKPERGKGLILPIV